MYPTRNKVYGNPSFNKLFGFSDAELNKFFGSDQVSTVPAVNVSENDKGFKLEVAAPGFSKENFSLRVEDKTFIIKGELKADNEEKTDKYTRKEFQFGSFERKFILPENVDKENIEAKYENGVLTIHINKVEEVKQVKEIRVA